jgi:hypothetical protein
MEKTTNYTPEQTAQAVSSYQAGVAVEQIALGLGKSVRSVVAKLSREGVYVAKTKTAGAARVTKADLVGAIAGKCNVPVETVVSLEKASTEALQAVFAAL